MSWLLRIPHINSSRTDGIMKSHIAISGSRIWVSKKRIRGKSVDPQYLGPDHIPDFYPTPLANSHTRVLQQKNAAYFIWPDLGHQ